MMNDPHSKRPMAHHTGRHVDSEADSDIFDRDGIPYARPEPGKIGVAGAVFLILNKMVGTGSTAAQNRACVVV